MSVGLFQILWHSINMYCVACPQFSGLARIPFPHSMVQTRKLGCIPHNQPPCWFGASTLHFSFIFFFMDV
ncbi:hypothetical protein E2320_022843 [Naja naja]|nr:hypothetical protein E2320_022843 [Naja naja]